MAVLDGDMVVYVAQVPSQHSMRMFTEVGRRANVHDTGVGKAILAQLDDETVRGIVGRTGCPTSDLVQHRHDRRAAGRSRPDPRTRLLDRRAGAGDRGALLRHGRPDAPTPTAVSVSGPISRVNEEFAERAVPRLREAAAAIAADLDA